MQEKDEINKTHEQELDRQTRTDKDCLTIRVLAEYSREQSGHTSESHDCCKTKARRDLKINLETQDFDNLRSVKKWQTLQNFTF